MFYILPTPPCFSIRFLEISMSSFIADQSNISGPFSPLNFLGLYKTFSQKGIDFPLEVWYNTIRG